MHARKVIVDGARLLERVQMARCRDRRTTRRMLIARLCRRLLPVLVLLVAMSAVAFAAASDPEPYLRPQRLVDVGGHRLNIYCTGSGAPTVILEAGHGSSMIVWRDVQAVIAQHTRTCAYDRAGMGFSDGAPPPRDAAAVVTDLHALLRRAGIRGPYVLVAHSLAGLYGPLFADRYPSDVAGMVLVDPSLPYQYQRFSAIAPAMIPIVFLPTAVRTACYDAAKAGTLAADAALMMKCRLSTPAQLQATCAHVGERECAVLRVEAAQQLRPAFWLDANAEIAAMNTTTSAEMSREQRRYGDLPLIVLTGAKTMSTLPIPASQVAAAAALWQSGHDHFARQSTAGASFIVAGSGHMIETERPADVVSAVDEVVDEARARSRR